MKCIEVNKLSPYQISRWLLPLLLVFAVTIIQMQEPLRPLITGKIFVLFYPAIFFGALFGGFGPGVIASAFATLSSWYFFVPKQHSLSFQSGGDALGVLLFFLMGISFSVVSGYLRKSILKEREEHARAVHRASELLAVLDNMVDSVFVCDTNGNITLVNQPGLQLLGVKNVEEAKKIDPTFETGFLPRPLNKDNPSGSDGCPLARALAGEVVTNEYEKLVLPWNKKEIHVRTNAAPIRSETGIICGAVKVVRDETEIRGFEQMKDDFIKVAAHELKTPITIIKGYSQMLPRKLETQSPTILEMLRGIDSQTDRIERIINDLIYISRFHSGLFFIERKAIDLSTVLKQAINQLTLISTKHRISVSDSHPAMVYADQERLIQVIEELVGNAVKYSPTGGEIQIRVQKNKETVTVSIQDHGVGIPKDRQGRIFERFYRAHTNTPHDYGGIGVGLYISKEIINKHGGKIGFESEEGVGSTFYFSLPLNDRKEHKTSATQNNLNC